MSRVRVGSSPRRLLLALWLLCAACVLLLTRHRWGVESNSVVDASVPASGSAPSEEHLEQVLPASKEKMSKRQLREFEQRLACDELVCTDKCARKASPKCAKSDSCMRERSRICKKRCRKARCTARCKDEATLGYVEREMKVEACKDLCVNSDTCKAKCDSSFQPCKAKCRERSRKVVCKNPPTKVASSDEVDADLGNDEEDGPAIDLVGDNDEFDPLPDDDDDDDDSLEAI